MIIGYARVSTDAQALDAQFDALRAAGAEHIFHEKISGARRDRPEVKGDIRSKPHFVDLRVAVRHPRLIKSERNEDERFGHFYLRDNEWLKCSRLPADAISS